MSTLKKKIHIELIRIGAALLVIFNHTGNMGFELYASYPIGGVNYGILIFVSIFCKVAVPLFLMISGALLLNKDITIKEIWCVRIPRILAVLLITSLVYYLYSIKDDLSSFQLAVFVRSLYSNGISVHLWYLYAYIAFLMCVPFLRALTKNFTPSTYQYLVLLYVIFALLRVVDEKLLSVSMTQRLNPSWLWSDIVIYPLVGYYLERVLDSKRKLQKFVVVLLGFVSLLLAAWITHRNFVKIGSTTQYYHSFLILMPCCATYIFAKDLFDKVKVNKYLEKVITTLGGCTFGVYLMHLVIPVRGAVINLLYNTLRLSLPVAVACYCIIIFGACAIVTYILKLVPGVKKLL